MTVSKDNSKFLRNITTIALPIVLQDGLNVLVNMVDNFMVGSLGLHAVTAVGLANLVFYLYAILVFGISSGSAIFIGQFWGKKDLDSIHKSMGLAWLSGLGLALLITFLIAVGAPQIMLMLSDGDALVVELGAIYLRSVLPMYVIFACIATINSALRSIRRTQIPLLTSIVGLVFNVALTALFVLVLDLGVAGAAQSTVIARSIELCTQLFIAWKLKLPILGKFKKYFAFDSAFVRRFYVLLIPVVMNEFVWVLGTTLYSVIYKTTGVEGQGAAQIAGVMQSVFNVMCLGVGSGCAVMIANALGAGERDLAISYSRKSMIMAGCLSIIMGLALVQFSPFLIGFYDVPAEVKTSAATICMVIAIGMPLKIINFTTIIGILRSGGDTRFCLIIDAIGVWFAALPLLLIGAYVYGLPIHWLVAITYAEELVKLYFCLKRVLSNRWANNLVENM